jgi:toxin ParE1/3/4
MKRRASPRRKARRLSAGPLALVWTARALSDMTSIGDYIAQDDPVAAERWVAKLMDKAVNAASRPLAGRRTPELARDDIREVRLRSYRIVYLVRADRVDVLAVFEGHRLLPRNIGT